MRNICTIIISLSLLVSSASAFALSISQGDDNIRKLAPLVNTARNSYGKGLQETLPPLKEAERSNEMLDTAIAKYTKAINLNPDDFDAFMARSKCFAEKKIYEQARDDIDDAIGIEPRDVAAYQERSKLNFAIGDYVGAVHDASLAIELSIEVRSVLSTPFLGELFHDRGRALCTRERKQCPH